MAKIWVALIWSITINWQSQFTARSDTNNTNILKSYPIYTRNKFRRDVWSHQKREKGTTPQARCDSWGDSSYMESPEEQHLAWVNVLFWVTSHVSPELLSRATGLKFLYVGVRNCCSKLAKKKAQERCLRSQKKGKSDKSWSQMWLLGGTPHIYKIITFTLQIVFCNSQL